MQELNRTTHSAPVRKETILQFGEGNFLRAFADWMIQKMNDDSSFNGGIVAVQPIEHGLVDQLNEQHGIYTLYLNGIKDGQAVSEHQVIDSIQRAINPYEQFEEYLALADNPDLRFVVSNTTEAGIAYHPDEASATPPKSFPAKLTLLLKKRFETFSGASDKGLIFLPCELIDRNGDNLKRIILQYIDDWKLSAELKTWIENHNVFTNTLVDRIVPGYPKSRIEEITKELGYQDHLVVEGEQFHLWVIEGPEIVKNEFPADKCGLNVVFTNNMEPYRTRKVRILNGAHTLMVPVAYLSGIKHVRQSVEHPIVGNWVKEAIFQEICPTLDLPEDELQAFANDVLDRFRNPYLEHELMSIALNSISKFKTRVLPSLLTYIDRHDRLPDRLCLSLAALIVFYKGEYSGNSIVINDAESVKVFSQKTWSNYEVHRSLERVAEEFLSQVDFWEKDLTNVKGLVKKITSYLEQVLNGQLEKLLQDSTLAPKTETITD